MTDCCTPPDNGDNNNGYPEELRDVARSLIEAVGEDPEREGLVRTPERFARAWGFLTNGYHVDIKSMVENSIFTEAYDEIVSVKHIHFFSLCEHHLMPFFGTCNVAYIPAGKVIGISKIPRIVDAFSRRLQIQERMTRQIARCLNDQLNPMGVAVVMEAYHLCMGMRGIQKPDAKTLTSELTGIFKRSAKSRSEVMTLFGMNVMES